MIEFTLHLLTAFNAAILVYFLLLNFFYLLTTALAYVALRRYARRMRSLDVEELVAAGDAPPVTLIAPAFNEQETCVEATRSLLVLKYPEYDVLVVNDGSTDATLERLTEAFDLVPRSRLPTATLSTAPIRGVYCSRHHRNLWVIDKENGGKADAMNAAINYCRTPLFGILDADTLLERDALIRAVRPFLENRTTVAAGGIIRIINGCTVRHGVVTDVRLPRNLWARIQVLEYLRAFLSTRMGWATMHSLLIISGAFGLFRRVTVVEAGGFSTRTIGEDMELVVRLHRLCRERRQPYRIDFVPDPVAWTQCPETLRSLGAQRDRWQRGLMQTLTAHLRMLGNPRYGSVGLVAFPYFFFLEMFGPLIELLGYLGFLLAVALGRVDQAYVLAFLALAIGFGIVISVGSVVLEELTFRRYQRFSNLLTLFGIAIVENLGYRQLSLFWRVRGFFTAWSRRKGWGGTMERSGFSVGAAP